MDSNVLSVEGRGGRSCLQMKDDCSMDDNPILGTDEEKVTSESTLWTPIETGGSNIFIRAAILWFEEENGMMTGVPLTSSVSPVTTS